MIQTYADELKKKYLFWGVILQMLHLVGLISIILVQLNIFTSNGLSFAFEFSFETTFVFGWFVSLLLALVGFVFLFKKFWFDYLWIAVIVVFKSLNGHSLEFEPSYLLVITNSIHLVSSFDLGCGFSVYHRLLAKAKVIYQNLFTDVFKICII